MTDTSTLTTDTPTVTDIQTAYPAQYYGVYDTTATVAVALSRSIDVWNAEDSNGGALPAGSLPGASSLLALILGKDRGSNANTRNVR